MAAYNAFNSWVDYLAEDVDAASDTFKVALCAAANAPVATNSVLGDLTTASTANLDTVTITTSSSSQTTGTYKLVFTDLVMTASDTVGPFQYVVIYDDTVASDPLVCWYDSGSEISLAASETLTLDFSTDGIFSIAPAA